MKSILSAISVLVRSPYLTLSLVAGVILVQNLAASPAIETSHATHSQGGGSHVFTMRVDSTGDEVAYHGTCFSVRSRGLNPEWETEGWYAPHGDLILSDCGVYLVRTGASLKERIQFSDNLGAMPCLRVYEKGELTASYEISDLVEDLSKVERGPEFYVGWLKEIAVKNNTVKILTMDGTQKSIETDRPAVAMIDLDTAGREIKKLNPEEFGLRRIEADKKRLVLEYEINELWEKLKMQVYRVAQGDRPMTGYRALLYADGKMNYLDIPTHGGGGLQDATVIGDSLYLTSDWGSGILRTMLYRVHRDEKGEIRTEELGVLSSAPKGLVDDEFLKDKDVVQITEALRPLTLAKGPAEQGADQPATAVESKAESKEEPKPESKPRPQ